MIHTLNTHYIKYFHCLFHPQVNFRQSNLTLQQAILLSWPFVIVGVMSQVAFSMLVIVDLVKDNVPMYLPFLSSGSLVTYPMLLSLFFGLWGILLFPVRAIIYALVLKLTIGFYQRVAKSFNHDPTLAVDLAASSMSSNIFRMIPVIGDVIQSLAQFLCLIRGLKTRMRINTTAAVCILMTPTLIMALFFMGIYYSLFLLIALLT